MGTTAGIGFTVALFIAELAFTDPLLLDEAKSPSSRPRSSPAWRAT